ncbi:AAA family ATPase [Sandaracinus amylolyticus]|uniref:AAA family ATPase n=1 Tax=Sandaracinus amylolyticus TaxID=927083 RepID=UPI001F2F350C|nr:AAA family ATPase [Sandaracinus amylolyticus]UJR81537.1 Exonuclease SbcC [Sandaracinus amylolyticus]
MILSLRLKGFRRYRDETFTFAPGINFVEGENNAGKSTVFYAIEYALFGRVTGHKTIAALMAPKARAMGVELVFRGRDGHRYRLQRMHALPPRSRSTTIGHFTLKRSARPIDAPSEEGEDVETYVASSDFEDREDALALELSRALGLTRRFFDVAVHLRQGEITAILEGAPRELDIVLGVTSAVVAADEMRAMALEREKECATLPVLEESLRRMELDREGGRAEIERLATERARLDERLASFEGEAAAIASALAAIAPLSDVAARLERARAEHRRAEEARADAISALESLPSAEASGANEDQRASDLAMREREIDAHQQKLDAERRTLDRARGDIGARIARRRDHAHAGAGARCEACGQTIDAALAAREIEAWSAELASTDARLGAIEAELATMRESSATLRAESRRIAESRARAEALAARRADAQRLVERRTASFDEAARALAVAIDTARPQLSDPPADADALAAALAAKLEAERDALRTRRARLDAERDVVRESRGRYATEHDARTRRAAEIEREHARTLTACERLRELASTASRLRVLSEGFRELQAILRDRAASALAEHTHTIHRALQGDAHDAKNAELKSVRLDPESYALLVTPNDIGREVPASAAQGGGHRLLLGLALELAIARLVGPPPFLLLDEPTYGLDRPRRAALLARIASLEITPQILLITHHDTEGVTGRRLRVVRHGKHSRVEAA